MEDLLLLLEYNQTRVLSQVTKTIHDLLISLQHSIYLHKISTAKGEYRDEDGQRIEVTIADAGGISMAIMGMAAWSMAEIDRESDSEIERTTTYKGHKAFEKYNKDSRRGEKALIVKDRFVVTVNGRDIDMKDLDRALDRIDIDDLEDMAK